MRSNLPFLAFLTAVLLFVGCSEEYAKKAEATRYFQAIERVLAADLTLTRWRDRRLVKATPAQIAAAYDDFCDGLEKIDKSACPIDFKVVYERRIDANREAAALWKKMPDGVWDTIAFAAGNRLLRGETDGGAARLKRDMDAVQARIEAAWKPIEKVEAKYQPGQ